MRHHLLSSSIATMSSSTSSSFSSSSKPLKKPIHPNTPNYPSPIPPTPTPTPTPTTTIPCKHTSPSATTLDLLILVLVLFSFTFLISSYFSHISQSLSLLFPPNPSFSFTSLFSQLGHNLISPNPNYLFYTLFALFFVATLAFFDVCCLPRSRKCGKSGCKGLKNALEFDLQLLGEKCLRSDNNNNNKKNGVKEIDELPWKGGTENNPDYECLRAELRKMAPPNGRAVLLFRAKCGCPVAKLEGWGPKRGRRHKNLKLPTFTNYAPCACGSLNLFGKTVETVACNEPNNLCPTRSLALNGG